MMHHGDFEPFWALVVVAVVEALDVEEETEAVVLAGLGPLGHRIEPVGPVRLVVVGDGREVELRGVPAADAVVRAEISGVVAEVERRGAVPLGQHEHVVAVLMGQPRYGTFDLDSSLFQVFLQHLERSEGKRYKRKSSSEMMTGKKTKINEDEKELLLQQPSTLQGTNARVINVKFFFISSLCRHLFVCIQAGRRQRLTPVRDMNQSHISSSLSCTKKVHNVLISYPRQKFIDYSALRAINHDVLAASSFLAPIIHSILRCCVLKAYFCFHLVVSRVNEQCNAAVVAAQRCFAHNYIWEKETAPFVISFFPLSLVVTTLSLVVTNWQGGNDGQVAAVFHVQTMLVELQQ